MKVPADCFNRAPDEAQQTYRHGNVHEELAPALVRAHRQQPEHAQGCPEPCRNQCGRMLRSRSEVPHHTKRNQQNCNYNRHFRQTEPLPEADVKNISLMDALAR